MFLNNPECSKWLLKNGIFLYRDEAERMSAIAIKYKGDRVELIANPSQFLDKLKNNIAVFNANEALLTEVIFSDFRRYDDREAQIKQHQELLSELQDKSVEFLNIKHAVLCKAGYDKLTVFDLENGHKHSVSKELADGLNTCGYSSSQVEQAYKDLFVNQWTAKKDRAEKNYNKVKAVKK